jgi:DNA-binding GntR family transcriptional regulator
MAPGQVGSRTMSTLEPIAKRSAEAQALDRLRIAILTGVLRPGARFTETMLADKLATSRATIRTALHHLVAEGLAVQVPYTGWMVTRLTANDAWELVTLRASFESLAASVAAERATPDARWALQVAFDDLVKSAASRKTAQATLADLAFHRAMVAAAGHVRLIEHYRRVSQQISILIASSNALLSDPVLLVAQHQPLLAAIAGGKSARAAALARDHIEVEGAKLIAHLKSAEALPIAKSVAQKAKPSKAKLSAE